MHHNNIQQSHHIKTIANTLFSNKIDIDLNIVHVTVNIIIYITYTC